MNNESAVSLPLRSLSKSEIDGRMKEFLNQAVEHYSVGDLYVMAKQWENAVKVVVESLQGQAIKECEGLQERLGHKIRIGMKEEWVYSPELQAKEKKLKDELEALRMLERTNGAAKMVNSKPTITVTLRA